MGIYTGTIRGDSINGSAGNDEIIGLDGNDTLAGGEGNDTIYGGFNDDFLFGMGGNDYLDGGTGIDSVYAGFYGAVGINLATGLTSGAEGVDTLVSIENASGGAFNDTLVGSAIANQLAGQGGNDSLAGMAGDDALYGGTGNDTLDGGTGIDTADYSTASGAVTVSLATGLASGADGNDTLTAIENIVGGLGNDTLAGNTGANAISGGLGNDALNGGAGNDTLTGGKGGDVLTGGAGSDRFVFDNTVGIDHVTDFVHTTDKLTFNARALDIGNANATIDGFATKTAAGGFLASAEVVVFTHDIVGTISASSAATAIGSATSAYAIGDDRIFAVDNGVQTGLFLFHAADANALVSAAELTELAVLDNSVNTALADYAFIV